MRLSIHTPGTTGSIPRPGLILLALLAMLGSVSFATERKETLSAAEIEQLTSVLIVPPGDSVARGWLIHLTQHSPTFREMLSVLHQTQHVKIWLRSETGLKRLGLLGRGRFSVQHERVLGLLEVERAGVRPLEQLRMVAHELAHAVEIALLSDASSRDALEQQLIDRGTRSNVVHDGIETPFAKAVGEAVMEECCEGLGHGSQLRALAEKHGVNLPAAAAVYE